MAGNKGKAPTLQPGTRAGAGGGGGEYKKHSRGRVSEQGSGPGTAHFLLRLCKPQAGPNGNRVTVEESAAARAGFGAASTGSADQGGMREGAVGAERTPPILESSERPQSPHFFGPAAEAGSPRGRGARKVRSPWGSDIWGPLGSGSGAARRQSGWPLSPGSLLPPHVSHPTFDLASWARGDWPGDGEKERGPTWEVRSPERTACRAPPSARFPEAPRVRGL